LYAAKQQVTIDFLLNGWSSNYCSMWALFWKWTGLWKAHKMGIRLGNFDVQMHALKAFAPLFPVAGKLNYASSVCKFLAEIDKDPQLEGLLRYAASVNISNSNHYFAYDEALETYGVKYVKQSLTQYPLDDRTLKLQIKAAQTENIRIKQLFDEFLNKEKIKKESDHIVISRKEKVWALALELLDLFENPNQPTHNLLQFSPELNSSGYNFLFTAYEKGKNRMESLLKQEVYGTEMRDTNGRRSREVNIYTYLQIQEIFAKKSKKLKPKSSKLNPIPISESNNDSVLSNPTVSQVSLQNMNSTNGKRKPELELIPSEAQVKKRIRRTTEDSEKSILNSLASKFLNSTPTNIAIDETLTQLNKKWDRESVLQYVRNARKRIKKNTAYNI
jgi:hypothetical protein